MTDNKTHIRKINFNVILADFMQNYDISPKSRQYHMRGSRWLGVGGGGLDPLENHKWLKIFLEILVRTPLEKQLDPLGPAVHTTLYEKKRH